MATKKIHEYIVVGSGCTAVQAAQTILEKGKKVLMLDVGFENETNVKIPNKTFLDIRKTDPKQQEFFLGKNYEGIPWGPIKPGYHLTPGRKYVTKDTEKYIPYTSNEPQIFESLAKGGLGVAWGTGSYTFDEDELKKCSLDPDEMKAAYATIFNRIGITEGNEPNTFQEETPIQMDRSMEYILKRFSTLKNKFHHKNIYLRRTPLAAITKDQDERKGYQYRDMDFWHDNDLSSYRPWITLNKILKFPGFTYQNNTLVIKYTELNDNIEVETWNIANNTKEKYYCKNLILAASVFGTARIVLRSNNDFKQKLNYLCNSYYYIPCINLKMFGKKNTENKIGFSQLSLYIKEQHNIYVANFFTYRSLLLFKLIKESPLNLKISRILFKVLESSLLIIGYHIPKEMTDKDYIILEKNIDTITKDKLHIHAKKNNDEDEIENRALVRLKRALKTLKCTPLKTLKTPKGASIHYAGTLPFSQSNDKYTTDCNGKLSNTKNVWIADASSFTFLPAKGVTLTAMANAHRVALASINNSK